MQFVEFSPGKANRFPSGRHQAHLDFLESLHGCGSDAMERTAGTGCLCYCLMAFGIGFPQFQKTFAQQVTRSGIESGDGGPAHLMPRFARRACERVMPSFLNARSAARRRFFANRSDDSQSRIKSNGCTMKLL
ncbi:MAG TPA: hypothetical protein PKC60_04150 [Hydrogenophaga sp.]|uniref:hypothetical protein n=1 Tax=Hydrogenophaga sp. TaxID=1904254 RepID=UPI002B86E888|nr:hypothetical protein [Hydrogenophaga sp.]HMN92403.1 hypothetical protein [Hydrogenophaga sp.]HMP12034.1 hypothetical protein [Hydrogenophaga sp.]